MKRILSKDYLPNDSVPASISIQPKSEIEEKRRLCKFQDRVH